MDRNLEDGHNSELVLALQDRYHVYSFPKLAVALPDLTEVSHSTGYIESDGIKVFLENARRRSWLVRAELAVSDLDCKRARELLKKFSKSPDWNRDDFPSTLIIYWHVLTSTGAREEADSIIDQSEQWYARRARENQMEYGKDRWPAPLLAYMRGKGSFESALKAASGRSYNLGALYLVRGLKDLQTGDKAAASRQFTTALTEGSSWDECHDIATRLVKRLSDSTAGSDRQASE